MKIVNHEKRKKKSNWPVEACDKCKYLFFTPINDARCKKVDKCLWLIGNRILEKVDPLKVNTSNYMPSWCPLEDWEEVKEKVC
jgi:hypothetical protein